MNKSDYVSTIFSSELNQDIKGFFDSEDIKILKENSTIQNIPYGMEYRPDKVAAYFLGNESYSWMITLANNFENGIKDYYYGRRINVPDLDVIMQLLERK